MLKAVALVAVSPKIRFFTVRELREKDDYGKYIGMHSVPIETIEEGEGTYDALERLLEEEMGRNLLLSHAVPFGEIVMNFSSGKMSRIFCYVAFSPEEFRGNPSDNDIEYAGWLGFNDFYSLDSHLRRKEVIPILKKLQEFLENHS